MKRIALLLLTLFMVAAIVVVRAQTPSASDVKSSPQSAKEMRGARRTSNSRTNLHPS